MTSAPSSWRARFGSRVGNGAINRFGPPQRRLAHVGQQRRPALERNQLDALKQIAQDGAHRREVGRLPDPPREGAAQRCGVAQDRLLGIPERAACRLNFRS